MIVAFTVSITLNILFILINRRYLAYIRAIEQRLEETELSTRVLMKTCEKIVEMPKEDIK